MFSWLNTIPFYVYMPHFIYSFIYWHKCRLFPYLGFCKLYSKVKLLDHIVALFWIFWKIPFSIVAVSIYISSDSTQDSFFSTYLTNSLSFIPMSHSDRCEVISHWGLDLHSPDKYWYWAFFHVPVGHVYAFFGNTSLQALCSFFNQVVYILLLSCMSS